MMVENAVNQLELAAMSTTAEKMNRALFIFGTS
jgi:hypothetical protein